MKTTIVVSAETRRRLLALGKKGESYDDIISEMLDKIAQREKKAVAKEVIKLHD